LQLLFNNEKLKIIFKNLWSLMICAQCKSRVKKLYRNCNM